MYVVRCDVAEARNAEKQEKMEGVCKRRGAAVQGVRGEVKGRWVGEKSEGERQVEGAHTG